MPATPSSLFKRPLLIYDDRCYSCTKFAQVATALSRGWIRAAGHYYSKQAQEAKAAAFPAGYDPTKMFWLINSAGAFGARSGLLPLVKEIVAGWFKGDNREKTMFGPPACEYAEMMSSSSCYTPTSVLKRLSTMLSWGATFRF
jgi:hypothetical protein